MSVTPRDIALVFRLILITIFGGMSLLFWYVSRVEDEQRLEKIRELDLEDAELPAAAKELTPLDELRADYSKLFNLNDNPLQRSELLTDVLNRLFAMGEVSVDCPFELSFRTMQ
jgi:hypothetical protein